MFEVEIRLLCTADPKDPLETLLVTMVAIHDGEVTHRFEIHSALPGSGGRIEDVLTAVAGRAYQVGRGLH